MALPETIGQYRICCELPLSRGDEGIHRYLATSELGKAVVVRVLGQRSSDETFRRFTNEVRALAATDSEFVVPLLDAGKVDNQLFAVSPFYADGSLEHPSEPTHDNLEVIAQCADGVQALHDVGIIHRNIHPGAMYRGNAGGLIGDLSLVWLHFPAFMSSGSGPLGNLDFIDPRIVMGEPPDERSDVWSLAVTTHVVLSGRAPYDILVGATTSERLNQIVQRSFTIDSSIPDAVASILYRVFEPTTTDSELTQASQFAELLRSAAAQRVIV